MAKTDASDPTDVPAGVAEERVDALYGLSLDEFTAARDALAKDLRKGGARRGGVGKGPTQAKRTSLGGQPAGENANGRSEGARGVSQSPP